ncbi:MAG: PfkB family carbohydrate kinase [Planctomycetota bacterium]|jgi:rfaE bifunctional protein kinase chain/domain|nr:PfkB family carbohydrate kinase [Planctomycetota bacterium]
MTSTTDLSSFAALRVAVVGDLIADRYIHAEPKAVSREAPVMVLRHRSEHLGAGGAANVARNALALGARVRILGAVGRDRHGRELVNILAADGADTEAIQFLDGWDTPTKTRVLAAEARRSPRQVLRLDRDPGAPPPAEWRVELASQVRALAGEVDVLLVSDYAYGTVGRELGAAALSAVATATVVLDPRVSLTHFKAAGEHCGLAAATPNQGELALFAGVPTPSLDCDEALARAAQAVRAELGCRHLLVTRGNRGMALFGADGGNLFVPISGSGEVTDVCGAGDTAAAVFALALAAGTGAPEAMVMANAASGRVVMENGAVVCTPQALVAALEQAPRPRGYSGEADGVAAAQAKLAAVGVGEGPGRVLRNASGGGGA